MMNTEPHITLICCSVLKDEVRYLVEKNWPDMKVSFINSMLHMKPEVLAADLIDMIETQEKQGIQIILVYGDCCAKMSAFEKRNGICRIPGSNCCEILLGKEKYRKMLKEGVFFLLPEWTNRWKEIFTSELGLNHENATSLMQEMHTGLVYLDTGINPVPIEEIKNCAQYCTLPFNIHKVNLSHLQKAIQTSINCFPLSEG